MATTLEVVIRAIDQFSATADKVLGKVTKLDTTTTKVTTAAAVGAAAGTVALNAFAFAAANASFFIDGATQAFIDDEQSVRRLETSLRANVDAWNGNTKAIEATIKARMKLGFTDEEQRNALGLTLVATHDVTQALAIQATAMDLARLKNIGLAEATSKLIKIEGGNFRALRELGIAVDENATQTEALIAVQKAAEGQAAAWADTTGGKLVSAQVRAGEATERLGGIFARLGAVVLPVLADGLDSVLNYIDGVASAADRALNPLTAFLNIATLGQFGQIQRLQEKVQQEIGGTSSPVSPGPARTSTEGGYGTGGVPLAVTSNVNIKVTAPSTSYGVTTTSTSSGTGTWYPTYSYSGSTTG